MTRTARRLTATLALVGMLAVACGTSERTGPAASTGGTETDAAQSGGTDAAGADAAGVETTTAEPAEAADSPLTGEFETLAGTTLDLASLQGQDVVLWFWAPW